jgi:hypothetical protein
VRTVPDPVGSVAYLPIQSRRNHCIVFHHNHTGAKLP